MDLRSIPVEVHAFESHPSHFFWEKDSLSTIPVIKGPAISQSMLLIMNTEQKNPDARILILSTVIIFLTAAILSI
jgi:hypothetical protein